MTDTLGPAEVAAELDRLVTERDPLGRRGADPRWIITQGALVIALLVLLTVLAAVGAWNRSQGLATVTFRDAVLGEELQTAYTSLSAADNAQTTSFLLGPLPSPLRTSLEGEFSSQIATARAKVDSAVLGTRADPRAVLASAQVDNYRGQVAAAGALQGVTSAQAPVQLRVATTTMRTGLLPLIDGPGSLLSDVRRHAAAALANSGAPAWWVMGTGAAALCGLVLFQVRLALRTRRIFNIGLVVAALAVVVIVLGSFATVRLVRARVAAADIATTAADGCSRTSNGARRAHAAETLWTVRLASDTQQLESVRRELAQLRGGSGVAADTCGAINTELDVWERSLAQRSTLLASARGGFGAAVQVVVGTDPGTSGAAFRALTASADAAAEQQRARAREALDSAASAPSTFLPIAIGLGVFGILGVVFGLLPRVREYA